MRRHCHEVDTWKLDGIPDQNGGTSYTLTNVTADHAVVVTFRRLQSTLATSSTAGGSVTAPGEPGPYPYGCGQVVQIIATPQPCYRFVSWTGDIAQISDPCSASATITMSGDYAIQANFALFLT
ncbi:MAG: InlB B-repeat-containing protein [Planctomycetota bacterium]